MREVRIKNQLSDEDVKAMMGKLPTDSEYAFLVTNDAKIYEPDGRLLAVYRKGIIPEELADPIWPVVREITKNLTTNRGMASGTLRYERFKGSARTETKPIASAIVGAFDRGERGGTYCRLTAWTGREPGKWQVLWPLLEFIAGRMKVDAPDRYAAQAKFAAETNEAWVIPGTVFSTVTVNRNYPTGVHVDKGDLDDGISTLAVLRKGNYTGGRFTIPRFGVAFDMGSRDLLLLNAHREHGNTRITCEHGWAMDSVSKCPNSLCEAERISIVAYYRTRMKTCGTAEAEEAKRLAIAARDHLTEITEADENAAMLAEAVTQK